MRRAKIGAMDWYVLLPLQEAYSRDVARGVAQYLLSRPQWNLNVGDTSARERYLAATPGPMITMLMDRASHEQAVIAAYPVVNVSAKLPDPLAPTVMPANRNVGRMAAHYLLGLGFQHFVFVGHDFWFSDEREGAFSETVRKHGFTSRRFLRTDFTPDAVRGLPRPLAIFAGTDRNARLAIRVCRQAGASVPGEVAVMGVDNDLFLCTEMAPSLTSIDVNALKIGYEAAHLAERLLHGAPRPAAPIRVPPLGVVERESTGSLAVEAPALAKALAFLRQHDPRSVRVPQLATAAGVSRRTLLSLCRTHLGTSLKGQVQAAQLNYARQLLVKSDMSLPDVAVTSGFNHYGRFSLLFGRTFGAPPGLYRRQHRTRM